MEAQIHRRLQKSLDQHQIQIRTKFWQLREYLYPSGGVDFSSNDFLSISSSAKYRQKFIEELQNHPQIPLCASSSRLLTGHHTYMADLEQEIASFHGAESGLFFHSGYDANVAVFSMIPVQGDAIIYDELIHASILDGMRQGRAGTKLSFRHNDPTSLEEILIIVKNSDPSFETGQRTVFISFESVYSMDGDMAPVKEFVSIAKRLFPAGNALLVIDEAHSTGLFGPNGSGFACAEGVVADMAITLHTFAKGVGASGCIVLSNREIRNYLMNFGPSVVYSSAISFPSLAAVKTSYMMLRSDEGAKRREKLQQLVRQFYHGVSTLKQWPKAQKTGLLDIPSLRHLSQKAYVAPIVALITPDPNGLALHFMQQDLLIFPIEYPVVPKGMARVRICFHFDNTKAEVDKLVQATESWVKARLEDGGKMQSAEELMQGIQTEIEKRKNATAATKNRRLYHRQATLKL